VGRGDGRETVSSDQPVDEPARVSRRGFLGTLGVGGAGLAVGGAAGYAIGHAHGESGGTAAAHADLAAAVPFRGAHQSGIATAAQDRLAFAAFDVTASDVADLRTLLAGWTVAAERMTRGEPVGTGAESPLSPPLDTGEALGLPPAQLTVTIGFGPSLFDDRFGLARRRPAALVDVPEFPGDQLEPERSGGDLCVQACSNDPQVAFHAVRNLARLGRGVVAMKWSQLGFGRTSSTSSSQATPRNLMGFLDGTRNLVGEDTAALDDFVWVGPDTDQPWMRGGSYLVARRIRMLIESWDRDYLHDQEQVIGRHKVSGAPLGMTHEHDTVDLAARGADGEPVIPVDAHIRLAGPGNHGGTRILRRGYSFTDGIDPVTGELDAGLFFLAYQRDPRTQFVPIQAALSASDALNEYIRQTSSAIFAVPPGVAAGQSWGAALLG
jgi:deferrochelatase/peroxidase EfeB